jgi:hypothetical protein
MSVNELLVGYMSVDKMIVVGMTHYHKLIILAFLASSPFKLIHLIKKNQQSLFHYLIDCLGFGLI